VAGLSVAVMVSPTGAPKISLMAGHHESYFAGIQLLFLQLLGV